MSYSNGDSKTFQSRARNIVKRLFRNDNAALVGVLVVIIIVIGILTKGRSLSRANISNIWVQSTMRGVAAMGQTFVIITSGIDLSVGGLALLSTVLGAVFTTGYTDIPVQFIVLVMVIGIGVGAANGSIISRIGMPPLIVTLGMWQVLLGIAYITVRGITVRNLPPGLNFFGAGVFGGVPVPVIIFVTTAVISYLVLNYTTFGRSVYAVGGNSTSAWLSGVRVDNVLLIVYMISGFLAALAGFIIMARVMAGGMSIVVGLELDSIAAVVIGGVSLMGGRGSIIGAVIGVLIIGTINNGINVIGLDPAYEDIVKGGIIIVAVAIDYIRRKR